MTAFYKFTDTTGRYYPSLEINVTTNDVVDFAPLGGSPPDPDRWTTSTGPATVAPGSGYTYPGGAATSPAPLLGPWVPNVAYVANQAVMSPSGTVLTRLSGGTSRATFDATEAAQWTVSGGAAYVALPANPTDGQVMAWSAGSSLWVSVNPTGNSELAYAANVTGTQQTAIGNTPAVDVTGCSISVPASTRPVYLGGSIVVAQTSAAVNLGLFMNIIEVSNGVDTPIIWSFIAPPVNGAFATITAPMRRLAASTARTRTFKLTAQTSASGTMNVLNSAQYASFIVAEAR